MIDGRSRKGSEIRSSLSNAVPGVPRFSGTHLLARASRFVYTRGGLPENAEPRGAPGLMCMTTTVLTIP